MNRVSDKIKAVLGGSIFLLALALGGSAAAQDGLIGYWPFDGNGADLSDEGRNLDLAGGVGFAPGLFGQALDLHGNGTRFATRPVDDVIYNFGGNDFTVQIWVNFNSTPSREQTLIEKFNFCCGPGWTLTYVVDGGTRFLQFYSSEQRHFNSGQLDIEPEAWHHILARRNGTLYQIFYDGNVVATGFSTGSIADTIMPLLIGKRNDIDGRNFAVDGRIDEVAIWSRALSDDEIAFLFNGGIGNPVGVVPVVIDIKPGSFPNSINLGSSGVIPVAILGSSGFDASTVDPISLSLDGAKVRVVGKTDKTLCHVENVNGDNLPDFVCQFENELSSQVGDSTAVLKGSTFSGVPIRGEDTIRIVP